MKRQIRAIAAVAAATMLLTGCSAHKQNNASEQTPTTQTQSSAASSSTETAPAGEDWSLLDHLPEWSEGTVTPSVTKDPNSGVTFGENPLNDTDWTSELALWRWKDGDDTKVSVLPMVHMS